MRCNSGWVVVARVACCGQRSETSTGALGAAGEHVDDVAVQQRSQWRLLPSRGEGAWSQARGRQFARLGTELYCG